MHDERERQRAAAMALATALTVPEAAAMLRVNRLTVYAMIKNGTLPAYRQCIGRASVKRFMIPVSALMAWQHRRCAEFQEEAKKKAQSRGKAP